jgi:hypothetical protein
VKLDDARHGTLATNAAKLGMISGQDGQIFPRGTHKTDGVPKGRHNMPTDTKLKAPNAPLYKAPLQSLCEPLIELQLFPQGHATEKTAGICYDA